MSAHATMPPLTMSLGLTPNIAIGQSTMSASRPGASDPTT